LAAIAVYLAGDASRTTRRPLVIDGGYAIF